jgi:hypothetical protein
MRNELKQHNKKRCGSVLVLTVVAMLIMSMLGIGMLAIAYGTRHQAIQQKNEAAAMLAAEAGYEKALFWMSQQQDMLTTLYNGSPDTAGTLTFQGTDCDYSVGFYSFVGARPVYRIISNGHSGQFNRTVNTLVMQDISGWAMGKCRIPSGATSTSPVNYMDGEIINMPLHINNLNDSPDAIDIYIIGSPQFLQPVAMGESRYTSGGADKYSGVMGLFNTAGIYFNQGDTKVVDEATVQSKVNRFKDSTNPSYQFTPTDNASVLNHQPAVQLEFFVDTDGVGKVRITNDCTVRGFQQSSDSKTNDFKITPGSNESHYERYKIYSYHVRPSVDNRIIRQISQTYVSQSFGGVESEPGGQIFVNGNVIIGSAGDSDLPGTKNTVKDKITVVSTGNIWVANSIRVAGSHDANGIPAESNPNVLGLISQGVVKVVDPGMSGYSTGGTNNYPGPPTSVPAGTTYVPVANYQGSGAAYNRVLGESSPSYHYPTILEAAVTIGGGGWGAENVALRPGSTTYGGRREFVNGTQDDLVLRGAITEACRGIVGVKGTIIDGYIKKYYLDRRLLEGVLPGDFWLQGQYIPAPAGWHDYRP